MRLIIEKMSDGSLLILFSLIVLSVLILCGVLLDYAPEIIVAMNGCG